MATTIQITEMLQKELSKKKIFEKETYEEVIWDLLEDTKELNKLDRAIQERILDSLERIRIRPEAYITKLVGDPSYKFRVGDYRILLDIDQERLILLVIKVGHRKNVYDEKR